MVQYKNSQGNIWTRVILAVFTILIVAVFVYDRTHVTPVKSPHTATVAWNEKMVMGKPDAPNKFVEYTDYFCSYCEKVQKAAGEEFEQAYIDSGKMNMENRVITVLKGVSPNTEQGAHAAYCAADQNKYWEYSRHFVPRVKADYWDKGIGTKEVANPVPIAKLPLEYFLASARAVELDETTFADCIKSEDHKQEIENATNKAIRLGVSGLPYMVINNYTSNGFSGGYDALKLVLKAGGVE